MTEAFKNRLDDAINGTGEFVDGIVNVERFYVLHDASKLLSDLLPLLEPWLAARQRATDGKWHWENPHVSSYGHANVNCDEIQSLAECGHSRRHTVHGYCGQVDYKENEANASFISQSANVATEVSKLFERALAKQVNG